MLKPSGLDLCRAQLAKRKENNIGKALLARLIVETVAEVVARGNAPFARNTGRSVDLLFVLGLGLLILILLVFVLFFILVFVLVLLVVILVFVPLAVLLALLALFLGLLLVLRLFLIIIIAISALPLSTLVMVLLLGAKLAEVVAAGGKLLLTLCVCRALATGEFVEPRV